MCNNEIDLKQLYNFKRINLDYCTIFCRTDLFLYYIFVKEDALFKIDEDLLKFLEYRGLNLLILNILGLVR